MIDITVREHLKARLSVPVYLEYPKECPDTFVVIENAGGMETNFILTATFTVHTIAPTMYKAAKLAWDVKAAMASMTEEDNVSGLRVETTPMNWTDTTTKQYRYRAVYQIYYMED